MRMHNAISSAAEDPVTIARRVGIFWKTNLPAWLDQNLDVGPLLDRGLVELAATNLWGSANREPSFAMWQEAGKILQHGWLQQRAREKPRGYAGDHEMLGAIYQDRATKDPQGVSFDHYFLSQAAPQAVKNRMDLVRNEILELASEQGRAGERQKIVVVGSGAGLEIAAACKLSSAGRDGEFWLLDLDPEAISLAESNLRTFVSAENLHCLAENLVRIPRKRKLIENLQNSSLVICTGFFDYLENPQAIELLQLFWQLLRPGGRALIFNFAPWNPTRAYMEWIGNWYLLYRNRDDLARIARTAGVSTNNFSVTAEASGIDLLLQLVKPT